MANIYRICIWLNCRKLTVTFCKHSSQVVLDFKAQGAETEKSYDTHLQEVN